MGLRGLSRGRGERESRTFFGKKLGLRNPGEKGEEGEENRRES